MMRLPPVAILFLTGIAAQYNEIDKALQPNDCTTVFCDNGGVCVENENSYFTSTLGNSADVRCSCPRGWTGPHCDIIYLSCEIGNVDSEGNEHPCFNGGVCSSGFIDEYGNDQNFCDCSTAVDDEGNTYVGKYCEHAASSFCDDEGKDFCLNGGHCSHNSVKPCICLDGFDGLHCEFSVGKKDVTTSSESQNPDADDGLCGDRVCMHGSTCVAIQDENRPSEQSYECDCSSANTGDVLYAGLSCEYAATSYCTKDVGLNGHLFCVNNGTCHPEDPYTGCTCTDGFYGFSCELVVDEDDNSSSSSSSSSINNDQTYSNLDVANNYSNGQQAVQTLNEDESNGTRESNGQAIVGEANMELPNANGGATTAQQTYNNYPSSEASNNNGCSIHCENDGVCRQGSKDWGLAQDLALSTAYLNETYDSNFEHCVCPEGFIGLTCEHKVEVCGNGDHMCLHGGTCVFSIEAGQHICDCQDALYDETTSVAGTYCQHTATDICTGADHAPGHSLAFCVNGGTCLGVVAQGEPHPGCVCMPGWSGPHCEYHDSEPEEHRTFQIPSMPANLATQDNKTKAGELLALLAVCAFVAAMLFLVVRVIKKHQYKKRDSKDGVWQAAAGGYRDRPAGVNIAPRRQSEFTDSMYLDSIASVSSSRDPMMARLTLGRQQSRTIVNKKQNDSSYSNEKEPEVYIGPPRDEDGHELHNVEII